MLTELGCWTVTRQRWATCQWTQAEGDNDWGAEGKWESVRDGCQHLKWRPWKKAKTRTEESGDDDDDDDDGGENRKRVRTLWASPDPNPCLVALHAGKRKQSLLKALRLVREERQTDRQLGQHNSSVFPHECSGVAHQLVGCWWLVSRSNFICFIRVLIYKNTDTL